MSTKTLITSTGASASGTPAKITFLRHDALHVSPTNPRKHFAPGPLAELAGNITKLGVQSPLHVRVSKTQDGLHEIIAGERRWRGTELAMESVQEQTDAAEIIGRLMFLPTIVVDWDDDTVIEFQLIENLQREDLTPLEEADGYQALVLRGHTPEQIAEKIGREVAKVYKALKWARLPALARELFDAGFMSKDHATLIARIPDEWERRRATLVLIVFPDDGAFEGEVDILMGEKDARSCLVDEPGAIEPMSRARARECVQREFMVSLAGVTFALDDAELVPVEVDGQGERCGGGACTDCPFLTGNNPMFADELMASTAQGNRSGLQPNVCTKPSCKKAKTLAQWERDAAKARADGLKVLEGKAAEKLFNSYGSNDLQYGSKFVDLEAKPDYTLVGNANESKAKPWEKLLKGAEVPVIVAQDPSGRTRRLVERTVAVMAVNEAAKAASKESPFANATKASLRPDGEREVMKKQAEQKKLDQRAYQLALLGLSTVMSERGLGVDDWWVIVKIAVHDAGMDGIRMIAGAMDIKPEKPKKGPLDQGHYAAAVIEALEVTGATLPQLQAMVVVCNLARGAWRLLSCDTLKKLCGHFEVSLAAVKAQARDEGKKPGKKGKRDKGKEKSGMKPEADLAPVAERDGLDATIMANEALGIAAVLESGKKPGKKGKRDKGKEKSGRADEAPAPEVVYTDVPMKDRVREYLAEHPGHGVGSVMDEFAINLDEAAAIVDALIDEKAAAIPGAVVPVSNLFESPGRKAVAKKVAEVEAKKRASKKGK